MKQTITLISHRLCPYVQRVAIVLAEKGLEFERIYIDLAAKPSWFTEISPLGKTPVLLVGKQPIFESAVICEYVEEISQPRLHPEPPLQRAQHRGWVEFSSHLLNLIGGFYNASSDRVLLEKAEAIKTCFNQLEGAFVGERFFAGDHFSIVDAAFAPVFRYFDLFDQICDNDFFCESPRLSRWRTCLAERESVRRAVTEDYVRALAEFVVKRQSALSRYAAAYLEELS